MMSILHYWAYCITCTHQCIINVSNVPWCIWEAYCFDYNVLRMVFVFCPQLQCEHSFTFTSYIIIWCLMRLLSCHRQKARPSSHLQPIAWGEVGHGALWLAERSLVCLQARSMSVWACPAAHVCLCVHICVKNKDTFTPQQKALLFLP